MPTTARAFALPDLGEGLDPDEFVLKGRLQIQGHIRS